MPCDDRFDGQVSVTLCIHFRNAKDHRRSIFFISCVLTSTDAHPASASLNHMISIDHILPSLKSREIGRGEHGQVYKVKFRGIFVAIKELVYHRNDEILHAEIGLLSRIRHPNITQFLSAAIHGTRFFVIMEYLDGGSLTSAIQRD